MAIYTTKMLLVPVVLLLGTGCGEEIPLEKCAPQWVSSGEDGVVVFRQDGPGQQILWGITAHAEAFNTLGRWRVTVRSEFEVVEEIDQIGPDEPPPGQEPTGVITGALPQAKVKPGKIMAVLGGVEIIGGPADGLTTDINGLCEMT